MLTKKILMCLLGTIFIGSLGGCGLPSMTVEDQPIETVSGVPIKITLTGISDLCSYEQISYEVTVTPIHGHLLIGTTDVTYVSDPGYCGEDSFKFRMVYTVNYNQVSYSNEATVTITVMAPPVCTPTPNCTPTPSPTPSPSPSPTPSPTPTPTPEPTCTPTPTPGPTPTPSNPPTVTAIAHPEGGSAPVDALIEIRTTEPSDYSPSEYWLDPKGDGNWINEGANSMPYCYLANAGVYQTKVKVKFARVGTPDDVLWADTSISISVH